MYLIADEKGLSNQNTLLGLGLIKVGHVDFALAVNQGSGKALFLLF